MELRDILDAVEREKIYKAKLKKLNHIFKDIPDDRKVVCTDLIRNVAFMSTQLDELQMQITKNGTTEYFQNGQHQSGYKISATVQVYASLIKLYTSATKLLLNELPAASKVNAKDELATFLIKK